MRVEEGKRRRKGVNEMSGDENDREAPAEEQPEAEAPEGAADEAAADQEQDAGGE